MFSKLETFLKDFGCTDVSNEIYLESFTHSSFLNENKDVKKHSQRLEFIGDSVLSLIITRYIYLKYPQFQEKELSQLRSKLVREETLALIGCQLKLTDYLRLGEGEIKIGGRNNPSIIADLVESFMGAMFLVEGYRFAESKMLQYFEEIEQTLSIEDLSDYKTKLQEFVQSDIRQAVTYKTVDTTGPSNAPTFTVEAYIGEICMGRGSGGSKKKAEQNAAKEALRKLVV